MKKIYIFGSGNHAKVILSEILDLKKYSVLGFIDDYKKKNTLILTYNKKKYFNLGKIRDFKKKNLKNILGVVAIGDINFRKKIIKKVEINLPSIKWATIISKNAIVKKNTYIGPGSMIISNTVINVGTKIGKHCLINTSSTIDHDNIIKNFSSTGPGLITGGNVIVDEMSYLSIGSVIKNNINIGRNTIIGACSYINKNCNSNSVYYGVPGKKIRVRKFNQSYF